MTEHALRTADLSLPALAAKLVRVLDQRRAMYRGQVNKRNMAADDAVEASRELAEIQRLFALWSDHAPEFRDRWPEIKAARAARRVREDLAAVHGNADPAALASLLESHPAVAAVTESLAAAGFTPTLTVIERDAIDAAPDRDWTTDDPITGANP